MRFYCDTCPRSYKYKTGLNTHKRVECQKLPQLNCSNCDKRFYHLGDLRRHFHKCILKNRKYTI